jgi:hypothetical protein
MYPYWQDMQEPQPAKPQIGRWLMLLILVAAGVLGLLAMRTQVARDAIVEIVARLAPKPAPRPAPVILSPTELDGRLANLTTQAQAELLLAESVDGSTVALDRLFARSEGWRGTIQQTPTLTPLLLAAYGSGDLRVRAASLDVYLDVYNVSKDSMAVSAFEQRVAAQPQARPWALWVLAALGNRGVEPIGVLREEMTYMNDPNEETRAGAVEGLSILGTDAALEPLLDSLRNDPSPRVRERTARGLAQRGMFTRAQRMIIVPRLLDMVEDPAVDGGTRNGIYNALTDITGASIGSDPKAWRSWWNEHHP